MDRRSADGRSRAPLRMTVQTQLVVQALLREPGKEMYGLELSDETGLLTGTIYPILLRLEQEGWVASRREDIDPHVAKRPPRIYYSFTGTGATEASAALKAARRPESSALRRLARQRPPKPAAGLI